MVEASSVNVSILLCSCHSFLTIVGDRNCHVLCTLYWKKYHSYSFVALAALLVLHTHNNTDSYKLEFFFVLWWELFVSKNIHWSDLYIQDSVIDFIADFHYYIFTAFTDTPPQEIAC